MPTQLFVGPNAPSGKKTTVLPSVSATGRSTLRCEGGISRHGLISRASGPMKLKMGKTTATPAARSPERPESIPGLSPPSGTNDLRRRIGDVAVELGFVDRELVEQVMSQERERRLPMGALLIESGIIDSSQLARILAERNSLDYDDLNEFEVDQGAANLVDAKEARRAGAIPIAFLDEGVLLVATADPSNVLGTDDIAIATGHEVRRAVATPEGIEALISRLSNLSASVKELEE